LKIACCLSVFLSSFLSGYTEETPFEKAKRTALLQLADKERSLQLRESILVAGFSSNLTLIPQLTFVPA
jgi:hypothetical protein